MTERELYKILKKSYKRKRAKALMTLFPYFEDEKDFFSFDSKIIKVKEDVFIEFASKISDISLDNISYYCSLLQKNKQILPLILEHPTLYTPENIRVFGDYLFDLSKTKKIAKLIKNDNLTILANIFEKLTLENRELFLNEAGYNNTLLKKIEPLDADFLNHIFSNIKNLFIINLLISSELIEKLNTFYSLMANNPNFDLLFSAFKNMGADDILFMINHYSPENEQFFNEFAKIINNTDKRGIDLSDVILAAKSNFIHSDPYYYEFKSAAEILRQQENLNELAYEYFEALINNLINNGSALTDNIFELKKIVSQAIFNIDDYFVGRISEDLRKKKKQNSDDLLAIEKMEEFLKLTDYKDLLEFFNTNKNFNSINLKELTSGLLEANQTKIVSDLFNPKDFEGEKSVIMDGDDAINCYTLTGEPFKMCIHSIVETTGLNISFTTNKHLNTALSNPLEFINENIEGNIHLSTSIISEHHSGFFGNPQVLLGFSNINTEEILFTSMGDGATSMQADILFTPDSYSSISDVTRFNYSNFYNEVVIPRKNQGQKRKPDYIVFLNNSWPSGYYPLCLKYAKAYNIPLVIIDCASYTKKATDELEKRFTQYSQEEFSYINIISLIRLTKQKLCYANHVQHDYTREYYEIINRYCAKVPITVNAGNSFEIEELLEEMDEITGINSILEKLRNETSRPLDPQNPGSQYYYAMADYLSGKISDEEFVAGFGETYGPQLLSEAQFVLNYKKMESLYQQYLNNNLNPNSKTI